eukprot:8502185-Lingulodinium_polyedra.AAC.1
MAGSSPRPKGAKPPPHHCGQFRKGSPDGSLESRIGHARCGPSWHSIRQSSRPCERRGRGGWQHPRT